MAFPGKTIVVFLMLHLLGSVCKGESLLNTSETCRRLLVIELPMTIEEMRYATERIALACYDPPLQGNGPVKVLADGKEDPEDVYPAFRILSANGVESARYIENLPEENGNNRSQIPLIVFLLRVIRENVLTSEYLTKKYGIKCRVGFSGKNSLVTVDIIKDIILF